MSKISILHTIIYMFIVTLCMYRAYTVHACLLRSPGWTRKCEKPPGDGAWPHTLFLTSPPWGVFPEAHDTAIKTYRIEVRDRHNIFLYFCMLFCITQGIGPIHNVISVYARKLRQTWPLSLRVQASSRSTSHVRWCTSGRQLSKRRASGKW